MTVFVNGTFKEQTSTRSPFTPFCRISSRFPSPKAGFFAHSSDQRYASLGLDELARHAGREFHELEALLPWCLLQPWVGVVIDFVTLQRSVHRSSSPGCAGQDCAGQQHACM